MKTIIKRELIQFIFLALQKYKILALGEGKTQGELF